MAANPRQTNGSARRKLRDRLKAEGRGCWICQLFGRDPTIDYTLPAGHPGAFEVDELVPVSRYWEGGYHSKQAAALDYNNLASVHRSCNQWRGNKSVAQVRSIALLGARDDRDKSTGGGPKRTRTKDQPSGAF